MDSSIGTIQEKDKLRDGIFLRRMSYEKEYP
jgi:hypothetical protein